MERRRQVIRLEFWNCKVNLVEAEPRESDCDQSEYRSDPSDSDDMPVLQGIFVCGRRLGKVNFVQSTCDYHGVVQAAENVFRRFGNRLADPSLVERRGNCRFRGEGLPESANPSLSTARL